MSYKPKFGQTTASAGLDLAAFHALYGADPFYSWIGLNSDLMYAAHKAAGGMTSVYRQVGIGCERLFRSILIDTTKYEDESLARWSYETKTPSGKTKVLTLDGRLELSGIRNERVKDGTVQWIGEFCDRLGIPEPEKLKGMIFEVRQGYKSKDSKRQNGDIDNAAVAWANGYLPVFAIFSAQIDYDLVLRYKNSRCGIVTGSTSPDPQDSLFSFCTNVLGYDLAAFFERNKETLRQEVNGIIASLLTP